MPKYTLPPTPTNVGTEWPGNLGFRMVWLQTIHCLILQASTFPQNQPFHLPLCSIQQENKEMLKGSSRAVHTKRVSRPPVMRGQATRKRENRENAKTAKTAETKCLDLTAHGFLEHRIGTKTAKTRKRRKRRKHENGENGENGKTASSWGRVPSICKRPVSEEWRVAE